MDFSAGERTIETQARQSASSSYLCNKFEFWKTCFQNKLSYLIGLNKGFMKCKHNVGVFF